MTTQAQIGYGRLLKIRDEAPSPMVFVTAGELTAVNGPAFAADAVDATHMESTDKFREFVPGLRDAGEVAGEINYVPGSAGVELMLANLGRTVRVKIEEPLSPEVTMEADAILTAFEITGPVADKMAASFTFKLSGVPTITGLNFA